jgi:hypothetical protein
MQKGPRKVTCSKLDVVEHGDSPKQCSIMVRGALVNRLLGCDFSVSRTANVSDQHPCEAPPGAE